MTATTRSRLIAAAIELVHEGGEDALNMRALGDRCGLSRGAPYRHFADKDALLRAIAASGFAELDARMGRAARASRGSRLRAAMHAYIAWALANPDWYRLTFQRVPPMPEAEIDVDMKASATALLDRVMGLVVEAQHDRELPELAPTALFGVLWSTLHGAVDLALAGHGKDELGMSPRRVVDNLLKAIVTAGPAREQGPAERFVPRS